MVGCPRYSAMWIEMFTQFCHIRGLSTSVWSTVACAVGMSEIVLVDDCVMSALTQVAYVFYKTQPARQYPYVLNRGGTDRGDADGVVAN